MNNSQIHIYDNIGAKFSIDNDNLIIGSSLVGFKTLDYSYVNTSVSYLLKNNNLWEVGLGLIKNIDNKIVIERLKVLKSSNNNAQINFINSEDNRFYVFANEFNFNTAFNNCITVDSDKSLENVRSTYLVDLSQNNINLTLPNPETNTNLVIEIKTGNGSKFCKLNDRGNISVLSSNTYAKYISNGSEWIELLNITNNSEISSYSSSDFSSLNAPVGTSGSFQYNNGGDFASGPLYLGQNNKLLLGSATEASAFSILPSSGNYSTVFNNSNNASDFIVKGSGDKNIFFGYEGRLGINIPSGSRPQTSLHILNNACQEGIRLENRNQCYPSNITLYHKPNTVIQPGSTIATINLSAKNSSNNQVEYVQLLAKANSYTTNATKGEFSIKIDNNGSKIEPLRVTTSGIFLSQPLYVNSFKYNISTTSGNILMSDGNGNMILTNVNNTPIINLLDGGVVQFTGVCS